MGNPTLNDIENGAFMRGSDVYANDGAILGEVHGNLEPKVNIRNFNNMYLVSVDWKFDYLRGANPADSGTWVAVGTYTDIFTMRITKPCTLINAHYIGYDFLTHSGASTTNLRAFVGTPLGAGVWHHGGERPTRWM